MKSLNELRIEIDEIDIEIFKLLINRFELSNEVKKTKIHNNIEIMDNTRELEIYQKISNLKSLYSENIKNVYSTLMSESKAIQKK